MNRFYGKPLTKREKSIARAYALDASVRDLKDKFKVTLGTIQGDISRVYAKLGTNDRVQLIAWALRDKLITPEELAAIEPQSRYHGA